MKTSIRMLIFLVLIAAQSNGFSQDREEITVEWIYGPKSGEITRLPRFQWINQGKAIYVDRLAPREAQTLQLLNPSDGSMTPLFDQAKAVASLRELLGPDQTPTSLPWPLSFDASGLRGVYLFQSDIFVLDVGRATFNRITNTAVAEQSVNFSPNGRNLAFVRDNDLYVYDLAAKKEKRLTRDGTETLLNGTLSWVYWEEIFGRRNIGYWWSDDSKRLAFLQSDESSVSVMHFVDFQPAVPRVIKQRYPKAGGVNPSVRVGVVDIKTGERIWVRPGDDHEYIARVKWLPDSNRLSVQTMNRDQNVLNLHFADGNSGESQLILTETDTAWVNIHDDLYFMDHSRHFIWASERDGYSHLYRYRTDGTLVNQVTHGDWAIRASGGGPFWLRQSVSAIDERGGWIYFTALKKASVEKHLYRAKLDGSKIERISHETGTHGITFSPDGRFYFDRYSNLTTPPSLTLREQNGKAVKVLAEARSDLVRQLDFQYPEITTIPARDGFRMPAEILRPKDFSSSRRHPVILHVYGGPSAPTVANAWKSSHYFDQVLLREGYLVVKVDNRAATAISKDLENLMYKQLIGTVELDDLVDAVKWLKKQSYVDPDRVGVWGWSGGGSYTLNAMTHSREFKAGISVAPVTDWHYYDTKWAEFTMKRPEDNPGGYASTSLVASAKNLHGRLLLVHGTYDDNVHPQHSWHFIDELIKANIQFEMMFYPMRKHGISDRPARIHLYNTMLEFWRRNL